MEYEIRTTLFAASLAVLSACAGTSPSQPSGQPTPVYILMTDEDVRLANRTLQDTLDKKLSNTTMSWRNADSGNSGTVTPKRTYRAKGGFFCRVYEETITVRSIREVYMQTACRSKDGFWNPL